MRAIAATTPRRNLMSTTVQSACCVDGAAGSSDSDQRTAGSVEKVWLGDEEVLVVLDFGKVARGRESED